MPRKGTVDRLGPEVRDAIGRLLDQGRTLDEILAHLEGMSVEISRSALGRYTQRIAAAGEKVRQSQVISEAVIRRFGDGPENRAARLNIQLLQTAVFDLLMKDETEADAETALKLSKALSNLATASRADAEIVERAEKRAAERAKKEAAAAVDRAGKAMNLDPAVLKRIREEMYGLAPKPEGA
jgi:hypothetical protein